MGFGSVLKVRLELAQWLTPLKSMLQRTMKSLVSLAGKFCFWSLFQVYHSRLLGGFFTPSATLSNATQLPGSFSYSALALAVGTESAVRLVPQIMKV